MVLISSRHNLSIAAGHNPYIKEEPSRSYGRVAYMNYDANFGRFVRAYIAVSVNINKYLTSVEQDSE